MQVTQKQVSLKALKFFDNLYRFFVAQLLIIFYSSFILLLQVAITTSLLKILHTGNTKFQFFTKQTNQLKLNC